VQFTQKQNKSTKCSCSSDGPGNNEIIPNGIGSGVLYTELKIPTEFLLSILKKTEFLLSGCAFSFLNDDANIANNKKSELLYITWLF